MSVRVIGAAAAPALTPRLNLIKLSVGTDSIDNLAEWQSARMAERQALGVDSRPRHVTRMTPRRADELLPGGSIYWVIRGEIQARQPLAEIEAVTGQDGINRCALIFEPFLIRTRPTPRRPFQGWRYLKVDDSPADTDADNSDLAEMPKAMRDELIRLGLL